MTAGRAIAKLLPGMPGRVIVILARVSVILARVSVILARAMLARVIVNLARVMLAPVILDPVIMSRVSPGRVIVMRVGATLGRVSLGRVAVMAGRVILGRVIVILARVILLRLLLRLLVGRPYPLARRSRLPRVRRRGSLVRLAASHPLAEDSARRVHRHKPDSPRPRDHRPVPAPPPDPQRLDRTTDGVSPGTGQSPRMPRSSPECRVLRCGVLVPAPARLALVHVPGW